MITKKEPKKLRKRGGTMMFFCKEESLIKTKALQAVANDYSGSSTDILCDDQISSCKRMSWCASWRARGSMTVEAALAFPFFVFVLTALLYLLVLLRIETEVGRALTDAGREMAQNASLMESSLLAGTEGKARVKEYLDGRSGVEMLQNGADGISLAGSTWSFEDSILTLRASYQVLLPPGISWFHPVRITQTKVLRGWTGFGKRQAFSGEEVVYVTDYGTVYHRRLNCRHLKLFVQQAAFSQIAGLRNESGGKYTPCERCWRDGSQVVYVTKDGNRYHETLNCSGLVRGIRTVLISETGGLPPCSVCGG